MENHSNLFKSVQMVSGENLTKTVKTPMNIQFNLSECEWTVSNKDKSITVPASIPGSVHMDLLKAGHIKDPYVGNRDTEYVLIE